MIGKMLGNRYEIVEKIGGGGMALVYKAKCKLLNRYVAIKILRNEFTNDEEFITKFKRESQAAASLSHPNIVNVYDVGIEDNIYYIVMEYVKGKTLKELIKQKGKIYISEAVNISIQIAEALSHAHDNHIVHRDIKPHNILMTEDGRAKVTDFGIARAATSATMTNTSSVIGSVHYFSPEQARGGYTDEKSDIYSLGIVMYEMVTGKLPFQGDSPISVALKHVQDNVLSPKIIEASVPHSFESIIMKCVKKNQSLRYNSTRELLRDLRKCKVSDEGDFIKLDDAHDSPTRIIPAVKDDSNMIKNNKRRSRQKKTNENNKENKNKRLITIVAVISALLVAAVLIGMFFIMQLQDFLTVQEVEVPNVVGMSDDVARQEIESLGLKYEILGEEYSSKYEAGFVMEQKVEAGDLRKVGWPIQVIISKGQELVTVPNLIYKLESDINIELNNIGLGEVNIEYENSDFPTDTIIRQSPDAYEEVPAGTEVNLVISKGPEINTLFMPKFVGRDIQSVKSELIALGLAEGNIDYDTHDEYAEDIVIRQSIPANTEVEEGEQVSFIVSLGPAQDTEDPQNGEDTGGDTPQDPVEDEKSRPLVITNLPTDKETVRVKIVKITSGESRVVYNQVHNTADGPFSVIVSGTGRAFFTVYFDDDDHMTKEINFEEVN